MGYDNTVNAVLCGHMANVALAVLGGVLLATGHPGGKAVLCLTGASWGFAYFAEQLDGDVHTKLSLASVASTVAGYALSLFV